MLLTESVETINESGMRYYVHPQTGERLPSITTILGHFKKARLAEWRARVGDDNADKILRQAGVRGTKVHSIVEDYLNNVPDFFVKYGPDIQQMFLDLRATLNRIDNIQCMERPLYSHTLGTAGRTDCIAEFDGRLSVIDFKTSLREKREDWIQDYFLQGTAYSVMFEELTGIKIDQVVIIIAVDHMQDCQLFIKPSKAYYKPLFNVLRDYKKEMSNVS
jgi:hypothetical protein